MSLRSLPVRVCLGVRWTLPAGHYILVDRFMVPRGVGHSLEVLPQLEAERDAWRRNQAQLERLSAAPQHPQDAPSAEAAEEAGELEEEEAEPLEGSEDDSDRDMAEGGQGDFAQLVGDLDLAVCAQLAALGNLDAYVAEAPPLEAAVEDCQALQRDFPLSELDFVVELVEGQPFRGPPFLERYGEAQPRICPCGASSLAQLLRNASEEESCLLARRSFQGSYSTLCTACVHALRAAHEAHAQKLRAKLPEAEQDIAVLLRLRSTDLQGQLNGYRIFWWMASKGVAVRVETDAQQVPWYVLKDFQELLKLAQALEVEAKGRLVQVERGVCTPHYSDPVDEALSTMNGKRTFMQTLEAQRFANIKGKRRELVACFKERRPMFILDGADEALIGSTDQARWAESEED